MSLLRRLLQPLTRPTEIKADARSGLDMQAMPTVKFDPSLVTKSVKADLRRNIELLDDLETKDIKQVYEVALRSILAGRNLHLFCTELTKIDGMSQSRAAEIGRSLHNKATYIITRERQAAIGITHAIWMYPNAPCMRDPGHPVASDVQQDSAHRAANGKQYEIGKGLFVDGKWTWPGVEEGCKCSSRAILPGFKE